MKYFIKGFLVVLTIAYPFLVYMGIQLNSKPMLIALLVIIGLLHGYRVFQGEKNSWIWVIACTTLLFWSYFLNSILALKLYPVIINLGMLGLFFWSLYQPKTIIERLARIKEPNLTTAGIQYTRKVTQIWCVFFLANAAIALSTVFLSEEIWAAYNGFAAYLLIGALLSGEWLYRKHHRRQHGQ